MSRTTVASSLLFALLLGACQANIVTHVETSGAGTLTIEIGLTPDEVAQLESFGGEAAPSPCAAMALEGAEAWDAPAFEEELRGQETWCVSTQTFEDTSQLEALYRRLTGVSIRELVEREGIFVYDVAVETQAPQGIPLAPSITWVLELPGKIGDHNADRVNGQRLEWTLRAGESRRLMASSDLYPLPLTGSLGDFPQWLLIAGAVAACLCLPGVLLLVGLIVFLGRSRRRAQEAV
jgi:hypothetical protein